MSTAPRPKASVEALPAYRPGRSAEQAMAEHDLATAIKLASNETPWGPLPAVAKAIESATETVNRYPDHLAGALRSALAAKLGVDSERVAVGPGSVGLLQQLCLTYAGWGDETAYGWRSFEAYPILTTLVGAQAVAVPLRRQTIDASALAGSLGGRTRLVLVATPNNPTGTALREAELVALADALPDSCLLVVDEAYREFVRGADVPDALSVLGDRPNVAVLRTFSKAYGLAALRIGYLVAAPEVIAAVDRTLIPFAANTMGQVAALAALEADDEMRARVELIVAERRRVTTALWERGYGVPDAQANFVWLPAGSASVELAAGMERAGVVTRPFAGEGVRVTIGTDDQNDAFLRAFDGLTGGMALGGTWGVASGEAARAAHSWLARLDDVERRLAAHAVAATPPGETEPDPATGERWDAGQVWAHLVEFGDYWLIELDKVLDAPATARPPFGRIKTNEARIAAVEANRRVPAVECMSMVHRSIDRLRARLSEMTTQEWAHAGVHQTLGVLDVEAQLSHFHVGHYEEHADQLDGLGGVAPDR